MTTPPPGAARTQVRRSHFPPVVTRIVGGGLLIATGAIHLDLYLTGYRLIPTIGWMFLLQVVSAFALGVAVLALGRARGPGRLIAASGAIFAVATLGGYLLSMWVGLFGFKEVRTTAGIVAAVVEICAFAVLGMLATAELPAPGRWVSLPVAALAVVLFAISEIGATGVVATSPQHSSPPAPGGGSSELHITIKNFAFKPARATVKPGERVVVKNDDGVSHTFTATGTATGKFNSGPIVPGQARTVVAPTAPGTYPFFCMIHPFMTGVLTVSGSAHA